MKVDNIYMETTKIVDNRKLKFFTAKNAKSYTKFAKN